MSAHDEAIAATANGGKPLVIAYTATWCGPCINLAPHFLEFSSEYTGITMRKVDYNANPDAM